MGKNNKKNNKRGGAGKSPAAALSQPITDVRDVLSDIGQTMLKVCFLMAGDSKEDSQDIVLTEAADVFRDLVKREVPIGHAIGGLAVVLTGLMAYAHRELVQDEYDILAIRANDGVEGLKDLEGRIKALLNTTPVTVDIPKRDFGAVLGVAQNKLKENAADSEEEESDETERERYAELASKSLFNPGAPAISKGVADALSRERNRSAKLTEYAVRHASGDFGSVTSRDRKANRKAITDGGQIMSIFHLPDGTVFWMITNEERTQTQVILPDEYMGGEW